jgi:ribose transport system substrate-binding protein
MKRQLKATAIFAAVLTAGLLGACGSQQAGDEPAGATTDGAGASGAKAVAIAFFGFAKANSFANATFAGIEQYAAANNATVEFFDGAFDSAAQTQQIQDATTTGRFQVYVIQANDGAAVVPAVEAAIAAGITVVAEFTPVGTDYTTAEPQVQGIYSVVDIPSESGKALGQMGLDACALLGADPCKVGYLQGNAALPLDNTRTKNVVATLKAGGAEVFDSLQGGYTADEGRTAGQDLLQAHPDVNVIIGSSQAIAGVEQLVDTSKVKLVGNGGSRQAVEAVLAGRWYGTYYYDEVQNGFEAAKVGVEAARGATPPTSINLVTQDYNRGGLGTAEALKGAKGTYDD